MSLTTSRTNRGFTLVELLVVIAIIGILVALLLPAIQSAREAARRTSCLSNMRNVGLSLLNFHDTNGSFPPAIELSTDDLLAARGEPQNVSQLGRSWAVFILPFIEEQPLFDSFVFEDADGNFVPISGNVPGDPNREANRIARGAVIDVFLCASDGRNTVPFGNVATGDAEIGDNWARGNYAANSSLQFLRSDNTGASPWPRSSRTLNGQTVGQRWDTFARGVMGSNLSTSIRQITDGTSKTVMITEVRAGVNTDDRRGVWAMAASGASSVWAHSISDATGPNSCAPGADNLQGAEFLQANPGEEALARDCMSVGAPGSALQATPRSRHPGGVHVCMVDGSAQFINENIDIGTCGNSEDDVEPTIQCIGTWQLLMASQDNLVIDAGAF